MARNNTICNPVRRVAHGGSYSRLKQAADIESGKGIGMVAEVLQIEHFLLVRLTEGYHVDLM